MKQLANMPLRLLDVIQMRFLAHKSNDIGSYDAIIRKAIKEKRLLWLEYAGYTRIVEPHTYGSRKNEDQIQTYQLRGGSSSGGLPQWRTLRMHDITKMRILHERFPGRRPAVNHQNWDIIYRMVDW